MQGFCRHFTRPQGAADLIASRIPPSHIDWVMGGWVVFVGLLVFFVFSVFVGLAAFLPSRCHHTNNTRNTNNTNITNNTNKRTLPINQTNQPK